MDTWLCHCCARFQFSRGVLAEGGSDAAADWRALQSPQRFPRNCHPTTLRSTPLDVIARRGQGQRPAHQSHQIANVVLLHRPIAHGDSFAKYSAVRVGNARSGCSVAYSRVSRARSLCPARLGRAGVGNLTPCGAWRQDLRFCNLPSAGGVCAIGGGPEKHMKMW